MLSFALNTHICLGTELSSTDTGHPGQGVKIKILKRETVCVNFDLPEKYHPDHSFCLKKV